MVIWEHDGKWFQVRLVWGLTIGLGIMYMPVLNQCGVIVAAFSLVITWDDAEDDQTDSEEDGDGELCPQQA